MTNALVTGALCVCERGRVGEGEAERERGQLGDNMVVGQIRTSDSQPACGPHKQEHTHTRAYTICLPKTLPQ